MISLKDNRTSLVYLRTTIEALERIDVLIEKFSVARIGIVYVDIIKGDDDTVSLQMRPDIVVTALEAQREVLSEYLAELGIDAGKTVD
jgi:hypothetical protein